MRKYIWKRMWGRKFAPYLSSTFMTTLQKRPGLNLCKNKLFVSEGELHAIYFEESELDRVIKNYNNFLRKTNRKKYYTWYEDQFKDFLTWSRNQTQKDFTKLNNKQLAVQLQNLTKRLLDSFCEYQFYAFLVLEGPGRELEKKLSDQPKVLQSITTLYKHTHITQSRIDLIKLVKNKKFDDLSLHKYLQKYSWVTIYDFADSPLSVKDVKSQIAQIKDADKELAEFNKRQKEGMKEYRKFLNAQKNPEFKKQVEIVHHFSYLKEMRDDYRRHGYYLWIPLWQEIANRLGLSIEEANCLLEAELVGALVNGKNYKSLAKKRNEKFAHWLKEGKLFTYAGKDAEKVEKMVKANPTESEIKGSPASSGKVRGRVSIIYHQREFSKFKPNSILVTTMTHPEFLPIMKKAKAIVTDEGGITCHAAIVSRELGMPCIIGTKNATHLLKDGDMVEVDANKGIVRKI